MRIWYWVVLGVLFATGKPTFQQLYCLHEVYRLENEGVEFDVYWIQIEADRFLAVYADPWKVRNPEDFTLDTHVSTSIDDRLWIGPRGHSLKYGIERWHKVKMERAVCWKELPAVFWIRVLGERRAVVRGNKRGGFDAMSVRGLPE